MLTPCLHNFKPTAAVCQKWLERLSKKKGKPIKIWVRIIYIMNYECLFTDKNKKYAILPKILHNGYNFK
ncbi:hypothetical protein CPI40_06265 [Moraxella catarrhalis]|uniref:Uncharacterized protein n=1 Tax=Moraxella catarrhalis TaxID=480 RepID=A0AB36DPN4_MORCA|nr:hypothetical protein [Moraxella catarrhalis]MPX28942.1 hypothetical protein [Moraxella catarrhalis]OAV26304.1 hypothetical protein AO370_0718 [Moraxella catarrhalis]RKL88856.1 hypothetical protein D6D65_01860 [Moraxella catarrhalis]RKL90448.1 hypothetical protein D6D77_01290 [Moraxella catarrhalis]